MVVVAVDGTWLPETLIRTLYPAYNTVTATSALLSVQLKKLYDTEQELTEASTTNYIAE